MRSPSTHPFASSILATLALAFLAAVGCEAQPGIGMGGTRIQPGQECPAGMTEVRPGNCQAPTLSPPTILDYRPRSTLVTAEHEVPKAKYPVIDYHGHPGSAQLGSAEALEKFGNELDAIGVRMVVTANNTSGPALQQQAAVVAASARMRDRVRFLTGVNFSNVGPGWAARAVAQLEADVAAGAVVSARSERDSVSTPARPMGRDS